MAILEAYHFVSYVQNFIQHPTIRLTPYAEEIIGDHSVGFDATGQLLIILPELVKYLRKKVIKIR